MDQSHPVMDPFATRALVTDPASEASEVLLDRKPDKKTNPGQLDSQHDFARCWTRTLSMQKGRR